MSRLLKYVLHWEQLNLYDSGNLLLPEENVTFDIVLWLSFGVGICTNKMLFFIKLIDVRFYLDSLSEEY